MSTAARFLVLWLICVPALAADGATSASAQVDALFAHLKQGIQPGAGVLVVWRGAIAHESTYGYADVANRVPLSIDSTFRLDSVSKQFTSMAPKALDRDRSEEAN